ncbi:hypothetical protein DITRI_Ditri15bG0009200 [Diplodiscus trichospermus]
MGVSCMCMEPALFAVKLTILATSVAARPNPGCQNNCGDVIIPYPFGTGGPISFYPTWMTLSKFPFSHTKNMFTAIGCDTYAYVEGSLGHTYSTGCLTFCNSVTDVINGSCSGIGCCQTAIPKGVRSYDISFDSDNQHSDVLSFNPCSYGFVVEDGAYNFSIHDLYNYNFIGKKFPIILD